ncbi:MAG TPA: hypothetical protein VK921_15625 [Anditalea sp.]|nr:hypothetical protein [Anditalea sp.]
MKNIPNKNIFTEPEGYFDKLPEEIISRRKKQVRQIYIIRTAVAAMLLIGLSFMYVIYQPEEPTNYALDQGLDDEVELYISSGYWQAEDVLLLSDDPNDILDQIIEMEYLAHMPDPDPMDDDFWY